MTEVAFVVHVACTWLMTGVIWTVQRVQYPSLLRVAPDDFPGHHVFHKRRISPIVLPAMLGELSTAIVLMVAGTDLYPRHLQWTGLALLAVVWTSTATVQIPQHGRLARDRDVRVIRRLVAFNWIRTAAWSARALLLARVVYDALSR